MGISWFKQNQVGRSMLYINFRTIFHAYNNQLLWNSVSRYSWSVDIWIDNNEIVDAIFSYQGKQLLLWTFLDVMKGCIMQPFWRKMHNGLWWCDQPFYSCLSLITVSISTSIATCWAAKMTPLLRDRTKSGGGVCVAREGWV